MHYHLLRFSRSKIHYQFASSVVLCYGVASLNIGNSVHHNKSVRAVGDNMSCYVSRTKDCDLSKQAKLDKQYQWIFSGRWNEFEYVQMVLLSRFDEVNYWKHRIMALGVKQSKMAVADIVHVYYHHESCVLWYWFSTMAGQKAGFYILNWSSLKAKTNKDIAIQSFMLYVVFFTPEGVFILN